jgi:hypothetical protein
MNFIALLFVAFLSTFAAVCADKTSPPSEVQQLVRIRQRMMEHQEHVPNYTCLETITRARRPPRSLVISANGSHGRFLPHDIVRLEVAEVDSKEFFAKPGAYNFVETDIYTFITDGMIGNGVFSLFAREVFNPSIPTYRFAGETNVGGRPLLRYDYQVSPLLSNYSIKCLAAARVGYHGSFWSDPKTLDTMRLDIQADDIPFEVGVVAAGTRIEYGPVRIGAADVLLPQSAEMTMLLDNGWEDRNQIAFTHCREYGADSVLSFDAPSVAPSVAPPPPKEIEIPPGLIIVTRLDTALDSETAGRGDRVHVRVESDVKYKGAVLLPQGTIITGRIRTIDRYMSPSHYFLIALEFYRIELPRGPVRFFAEMLRIFTPPVSARLARVPTPEVPGVATFTIKGDTVLLRPGVRMVWKTRRYAPDQP